MTEVVRIGEKIVEETARTARERYEKATKEMDRGAVKLEIHVHCAVDNQEFAPPLAMVINGVRQQGILNAEGCAEWNRHTIWYEVPIRQKGPDSITVVLEPMGEAQRHLRPGRSPKARYRPAYSRNTQELYGRRFEVPPKGDDFDAHIVEITICPRRRGLRKRKPKDIPKWFIKRDESRGV